MKRTYGYILGAALPAAVLLASCTREQIEPTPGARTEITLSASPAVGIEAQAANRPATKAVADPTRAMDLYFARADQDAAGTYGDYGTTALKTTRAAGDAARGLTFDPKQYYLLSGKNTKLTGWHPGGGNGFYDGTARTVSWTIDGSQDVMTATKQEGNFKTPILPFVFNHKLTQVRFYPYAEDAAVAAQWGQIRSIKIGRQQNTAVFDLADDAGGEVRFTGDADKTFTVQNLTAAALPAGSAAATVRFGDPVMIAPQEDGYDLRITVETELQGTITALAPRRAYTEGGVTNLKLKFSVRTVAIEAQAAIGEWTDGYVGTDDGTIAPVIPPTLEVDENGILVLKKGAERGQMLFFKFGGVVGFTQEGAWGADKILFNPTRSANSAYASWGSVPVYSYNASIMNISDAAYHNGTNVKSGKGDPCKLVGLTAAKIQSMTTAELDAYNSGWRLPTNAENKTFTGQSSNGSYYAHWTASDARYDKWYYSSGSAGGYFPKGQESQRNNYLPAAGCRGYSDGAFSGIGTGGHYWSSEVYNSTGGYYLYFSSGNVSPEGDNYYAYGFGARCVRR